MHFWAEMISLELWTLALLEATHISNLTRFDTNGRAPITHFSGSDALFDISDEHAFGCPAYVLDDSLQNNKKMPKWNSRIRVGICVGKSPFHAGSVNLVMNTTIGLISPQHHCVFDDNFTTVPALRRGMRPHNWDDLARTSSSFVSFENFLKTSKWTLEPPPGQQPEPSLQGFGVPTRTADNTTSSLPNMTHIQPISDPMSLKPIQSTAPGHIHIAPISSNAPAASKPLQLEPTSRTTPSSAFPILQPIKSSFP